MDEQGGGFLMDVKKWVMVLLGIALLFSACSAEASDFEGPRRGLPSLVMLSTPT
jgi:hypothetical protein